jgi:hypothetical protein
MLPRQDAVQFVYTSFWCMQMVLPGWLHLLLVHVTTAATSPSVIHMPYLATPLQLW